MNRLKPFVYEVLESNDSKKLISKIDNILISFLILVNVIAVVLETVNSIYNKYMSVFLLIEIVSITVFSIEYLLRIWCCTEDSRYKKPIVGRIKYILTPMAIIDFLSIIPFFIPFLLPDLRVLRVFRLVRVLLLFKLSRYYQSFRLLGNVLKAKKSEMVVILFILLILLIFTSSLMFYAENDAQPEKFSSIPESMWWGIVTLTTVGYGDIFPITPIGKFLSAAIAFLGIGLFALPAGIFATGYTEELKKQKEHNKCIICPHCGKGIEE